MWWGVAVEEGRGGRVESVKKGKFVTKFFLQIMLTEVLKFLVKICQKV